MRLQIEIAPGELMDRITILEIKMERIDDQDKLSHVRNEWDTLNSSATKMYEYLNNNKRYKNLQSLSYCANELKVINGMIWDVLQKQRDLEHANKLGDEFIKVSLEVYHCNDRRAMIKRKINELLDTDIAEVKSYKENYEPESSAENVDKCNRLIQEYKERNDG